jgi:hypothetical protein
MFNAQFSMRNNKTKKLIQLLFAETFFLLWILSASNLLNREEVKTDHVLTRKNLCIINTATAVFCRTNTNVFKPAKHIATMLR